MSFILAIDIGNSSTSLGLFNDHTSHRTPSTLISWRIPTHKLISADLIRRSFKLNAKKIKVVRPDGVIVSSVVPLVNSKLSVYLKRTWKLKPIFVTAKTKSKIRIHYSNPREVGSDRIVNARAAIELTPCPSIVIDFGTATTFDCINRKKEYLGGVITPGPVISAEALYQRTAKLPRVVLSRKVSILGKNTIDSIQAGLYHGYRGLVKEILSKLKLKLGQDTKVWVTGGQAKWILKDVKGITGFIPDLTLMGLFLYWRDISKIK